MSGSLREIYGCLRETSYLLLQSGKIGLLILTVVVFSGTSLCVCVCLYIYIYIYACIYVYSLQNFQTVSGAHPTKPGFFSAGKADGA
jgi:hypothetical protein